MTSITRRGRMNKDQRRIVETRLLVIVLVDVTDSGFSEAIKAIGSQPTSVAQIVSAELIANLESVSYIESVIVSQL